MSRWTSFLLQALAALGEADLTFAYPYPTPEDEAVPTRQSPVEGSDDALVRAAFRSIVEQEWGASALSNEKER